MKYLDLTLSRPAENLACDEALLDACEERGADEILRVWEPRDYFVVLGYANRAQTEANLELCRTQNVSVLRRCTGGGAVLQGLGCLNYSLTLKIPDTDGSITATNYAIMKRQRAASQSALANATSPFDQLEVNVAGITDLALGFLKFSGNAQRRRKKFLLFHGSFLLNFDLGLIDRLLPMPSKQPDYRKQRRHSEFLVNLGVPPSAVKAALRAEWGASEERAEPPLAAIRSLVRKKYATEEWNLKF
ncbi:MAG: lipoate--protein ligase family protein [Verrucomicrobia bacterium]|nr:lipoate--protein ligase family protein [Verrucomicrobiota bacterium]